DDNINEIGVYLQSETNLPANLKFVAAARMDQHSYLEDLVLSPRAALVYTPAINHNLRATYNRAFSTPTSNTIFLDLVVLEDLGGIGGTLEPALGFNPKIDVRAQGTKDGFRFQSSGAGPPKFRSPYAAMLKKEPDTYFDMNDPIMTNVMWGVGRKAVMNGLLPTLAGLVEGQLKTQGLPDAIVKLQVSALSQAFQSAIPEQLGGLKNVMRTLNPTTQGFEDAVNPTDVEPIKPTTTQTTELGYKGVLANRLALSVDIYQTKMRNFVGPLVVETPNVFLEPQVLIGALMKQIGAA
ncbi:MAG: TonB-dependent receptor, partial [Candidatus Poribacteria bacterium]|nr:TonB-dependent receptor [Candidatus Poribacteria bacterium]